MTGLLSDTPERDYARKLSLFARFAEPELRQAIASLGLQPGMTVLDAGCGSGHALAWLAEQVGASGRVVGVDLAEAHAQAARKQAPQAEVLAGDLMSLPLPLGGFDAVWTSNTLNHFPDPVAAVRRLTALLKPGGLLAVGQGGFLPEMLFAWDQRLERAVVDAVRAYFRERYGLDERRLTAVRANLGLLRAAALADATPRTWIIERCSPVDEPTHDYLLEAQFQGMFGERLRPWLSAEDFAELQRLCDPAAAEFALKRQEFHTLHTYTLVTARKA